MIVLNPIATVLYLVHLGINIALLLLLIQWFLTWRRLAWLDPLAVVCRPITDAMTNAVATRFEGRFRSRKLSERGRLAICIALLTLADMCLVVIAGAVQ